MHADIPSSCGCILKLTLSPSWSPQLMALSAIKYSVSRLSPEQTKLLLGNTWSLEQSESVSGTTVTRYLSTSYLEMNVGDQRREKSKPPPGGVVREHTVSEEMGGVPIVITMSTCHCDVCVWIHKGPNKYLHDYTSENVDFAFIKCIKTWPTSIITQIMCAHTCFMV